VPSEAIDLADEAEGVGAEVEADGLAVLIGGEGGVQLAAGVDALVGDADLLDFFEVEQAGAVGQGVQGHDAQGRVVAVEDGQGEHGPTPSRKDGRRVRGGRFGAGCGADAFSFRFVSGGRDWFRPGGGHPTVESSNMSGINPLPLVS
jgi:hypothetical protein